MQHGARGALAAEHRPLDRCSVAMVAAHEHAATDRDLLLGVKRRSLSGLTVRNDVSAQCSRSPVIEPNQRASCPRALAVIVGSSASDPGTAAGTRDRPAGAYDGATSLRTARFLTGPLASPSRTSTGLAIGTRGTENQQQATARDPGSATGSSSN